MLSALYLCLILASCAASLTDEEWFYENADKLTYNNLVNRYGSADQVQENDKEIKARWLHAVRKKSSGKDDAAGSPRPLRISAVFAKPRLLMRSWRLE